MQRCSTYNCANFARRRDCQSNSHILIGGQFVKKKTLLGAHGKARRTVTDTDFFRLNTLKETAKAPSVDPLRLKTPRGAKPAF